MKYWLVPNKDVWKVVASFWQPTNAVVQTSKYVYDNQEFVYLDEGCHGQCVAKIDVHTMDLRRKNITNKKDHEVQEWNEGGIFKRFKSGIFGGRR